MEEGEITEIWRQGLFVPKEEEIIINHDVVKKEVFEIAVTANAGCLDGISVCLRLHHHSSCNSPRSLMVLWYPPPPLPDLLLLSALALAVSRIPPGVCLLSILCLAGLPAVVATSKTDISMPFYRSRDPCRLHTFRPAIPPIKGPQKYAWALLATFGIQQLSTTTKEITTV
jgi:hypothetical protein